MSTAVARPVFLYLLLPPLQDFSCLKLDEEDEWLSVQRLAETLCYCTNLQTLYLRGMGMTDAFMQQLASRLKDSRLGDAPSSSLARLKFLDLTGNHLGAAGLHALCEALGSGIGPSLETIALQCNLMGDGGAQALAAGLQSSCMPRSLKTIDLAVNDVGDVGAAALADALLHSRSTCQLVLYWNRFGVAAQSKLMRAFQARDGATSLVQLFYIAGMNPPCFPASLSLRIAEGHRAVMEELLFTYFD